MHGMWKDQDREVSALGHNWNEDFTVDKESTCEETGLKSNSIVRDVTKEKK